MRHTIQVKYLQDHKNLPAKSLTRQKNLMLYEKLSYESALWKSEVTKVKQTLLNVWGQSSSPYELYLREHSQADELILCNSDQIKQFKKTLKVIQFNCNPNPPNCLSKAQRKAQILIHVSYIWCVCATSLRPCAIYMPIIAL